MKKILLLSGIHICHNPRVVKEADALAEAGHEVTVLGMPSLARLREEDAETAKDKKWKFIEVPGPASPGMAGRRIYRGVAKKNRGFACPSLLLANGGPARGMAKGSFAGRPAEPG